MTLKCRSNSHKLIRLDSTNKNIRWTRSLVSDTASSDVDCCKSNLFVFQSTDTAMNMWRSLLKHEVRSAWDAVR